MGMENTVGIFRARPVISQYQIEDISFSFLASTEKPLWDSFVYAIIPFSKSSFFSQEEIISAANASISSMSPPCNLTMLKSRRKAKLPGNDALFPIGLSHV